jgi:SAM-dependent methyltransferase
MIGSMATTDPYARALGQFYAFYIERPRLARAVGALAWGTTFQSLYRSLDSLGDVATGATILDACCGGGLALRWLDPSAIARYVGIDISPTMLERAHRVARERGFATVEILRASVEDIPLADAEADVALLYNALHVVAHPQAAATEVARCLAADGQLLGTMVVRGRGGRADRAMDREAGKANGLMGPGGTADDLNEWLRTAGLSDIELSFDGTLASFRARRAPTAPHADKPEVGITPRPDRSRGRDGSFRLRPRRSPRATHRALFEDGQRHRAGRSMPSTR